MKSALKIFSNFFVIALSSIVLCSHTVQQDTTRVIAKDTTVLAIPHDTTIEFRMEQIDLKLDSIDSYYRQIIQLLDPD